jgi:hypothetical protein
MTMKTVPMPFDAPTPTSRHTGGFAARVVEWLVDDAPSREEARRRLRSKPGFFSTLSPEARAAVLSYDGPESLGRPESRR